MVRSGGVVKPERYVKFPCIGYFFALKWYKVSIAKQMEEFLVVKRFDKDFVWECDYGIRKPIIPILKTLLAEQSSDQLQMVTLLINNNIYNLEFFIAYSYDNPEEGQIERMKGLMYGLGLRYCPDLPYEELFGDIAGRRFNALSIPSADMVEDTFNNPKGFLFADKEAIAANFPMIPLSNKLPVFLSHTSQNKPDIEELIPYLNGRGLPIWYDKLNIDYGKVIIDAIQEGIKNSGAVIFWITKEFLKSNWCKTELNSFLTRLASKGDILIISVVDEDICHDDLPLLLQERKYIKKVKNCTVEEVAKEIIPSICKYVKSK